MKDNFPKGVWPTMVTPFTDDGVSTRQGWKSWSTGTSPGASTASSPFASRARCSSSTSRSGWPGEGRRRGRRRPREVIASGHISDSPRTRPGDERHRRPGRGSDVGHEPLRRKPKATTSGSSAASGSSLSLRRDASGLLRVPLSLQAPVDSAAAALVRGHRAVHLQGHLLRPGPDPGEAGCDGTPMSSTTPMPRRCWDRCGGAAGYSGVMANFHPQLYAWLCRHWREQRRGRTAAGLAGDRVGHRRAPVPAQRQGVPAPRRAAGHDGDAAGLPRALAGGPAPAGAVPRGLRRVLARVRRGRACSPRSP